MNGNLFIFVLVMIVYFGACQTDQTTVEYRLAQANNDLTFRLLKYYQSNQNVFISPLSISTSLASLYLGARGNTSEIMGKALKYDQYDLSGGIHHAVQGVLSKFKEQNAYVLSLSKNVLVQQNFSISKTYELEVKQYYFAEIESVDFATQGKEVQRKINEIVENSTRGQIKDFLSQPPSADTKLLLLDAVYFLGDWLLPFNSDYTRKLPFFNKGVDEKQVDTMIRDAEYEYNAILELSAQMIILPYGENATASMVIILPDENNGVERLQNQLDSQRLDELVKNVEKRRILLKLPKFKLNYKTDVKEALSSIGVGIIFSGEADLSGMVSGGGLMVSSIQHKAVIEVNERGSQAAAATSIEIVPLSLPPKFEVDHPFLFYIRDNRDGMILFAGRVDSL